MTVPVLLLIFNRPDTTKKVFDIIRQVKPSKLFVASDGPREGNSNDERLCKQARNITEQVDWECDVKYLYRDKNLGCRVAISSGIDWFFEYVDEGIILEDDCLPSKSFFCFCQELLEKYRDDERVMQINGNYYLDGLMEFKESYYFSALNACWGWATWKRAWKQFDSEMTGYHDFKKAGSIKKYFKDKDISDWMESYLDEAAMPNCNIWSTQWSYAIIKSNGLSITPTVNFVQNIGFTKEATTGSHESFKKYTEYLPQEMDEITHPGAIEHAVAADVLQFKSIIKLTDPRCTGKVKHAAIEAVKNLFPQRFKDQIKKYLGRFL